jgi:pimeloyl-ACP methyl ester carboxylesterase
MSSGEQRGHRGMTTHTFEAPGAVLTYDVREAEGADGAPPLMLIGSPMDATGFVTLASRFPDRTVVTYDPRGTARSAKADPASESTPDQHAGDIRGVIEAVGLGPVDLFASSGGAVNALALIANDPEPVRTLVAHEPPASQLVEDREEALAAAAGIRDTYLRDGFGPAMAKFIMLVSHQGPVPAGFAEQAVDPAAFGLPIEDDGRRDDPLLFQNMVTCNFYEQDLDALRAAPTRIVVGVGAESEGQLARRGGEAVAHRLGLEPVILPGGHGGFLGDEYGQPGDPDAFAAKLREVLEEVRLSAA